MNYIYSFIVGYINPVLKYLFYPRPTITNKKHNGRSYKNPIPKKIRTEVWKKYHGNNMLGQCYACGCAARKCLTFLVKKLILRMDGIAGAEPGNA